MNLNGKKLFLIGFIVVLLVGIPLTVYLLQQQQEVRSHAEASTNLAFNPSSTSSSPIQKNVGDSIPLDISVDPGKNLVSFVKLEIQYDPSVLATTSGAFKANTDAFPSVLEGPVYSDGKIAVTLSVGPDPTKAIQQKVTAGTITFTALKNTDPGTPTLVTFTTNTQVLSIGSNDQASENVLSSATPATIAISGSSITTTPSVPITSPSPSQIPTVTLTVSTGPSPTTAPSTAPTGSGSPPTCTSLTTDRSATGNAPFSLTFTASGNSSSGTISKVTFNFGDGQVSDVTDSGGIGTATVNVQASHTYNNPGNYTATATLTDNNNAVSTTNTCSQPVTVSSPGAPTGTGGGGTNPSPTMPATGSTGVAVGIGLGTLLLIIGGGLLFFVF